MPAVTPPSLQFRHLHAVNEIAANPSIQARRRLSDASQSQRRKCFSEREYLHCHKHECLAGLNHWNRESKIMNKFPLIPLRALVLSAAVLCLESGFADEPLRLNVSNEQDGTVAIHLKVGQGLHHLQRLSSLDGDWLNFVGLTSEPDGFVEQGGS